MSFLQILWFTLIGVLFSGFFFLEGFDFGVGMQFATLAKNSEERESLYKAIGPHWDANEVWLLTAGGAMFASYPFWYASLFSGFYLMLFIVLLALIYRGASFEFRDNMQTFIGRRAFERLIALSSFAAPFFLGMIFTAMVKGMPLDAKGNISASFFDYVNLYSIVGGVAVALIAYIHGLNYTRLKIEGDVQERAHNQLKIAYPLLLAGEVAFAVLTFFYTDFLQTKLVIEVAVLGLIVVTTLISWLATLRNRQGLAFIFSGLIFVELVAFLFVGLFPRVMVANNHVNDILAVNASSTPYTLQVMTIVTVSALPIVLAYQIWSFIVFRKRIVVKNDTVKHAK